MLSQRQAMLLAGLYATLGVAGAGVNSAEARQNYQFYIPNQRVIAPPRLPAFRPPVIRHPITIPRPQALPRTVPVVRPRIYQPSIVAPKVATPSVQTPRRSVTLTPPTSTAPRTTLATPNRQTTSKTTTAPRAVATTPPVQQRQTTLPMNPKTTQPLTTPKAVSTTTQPQATTKVNPQPQTVLQQAPTSPKTNVSTTSTTQFKSMPTSQQVAKQTQTVPPAKPTFSQINTTTSKSTPATLPSQKTTSFTSMPTSQQTTTTTALAIKLPALPPRYDQNYSTVVAQRLAASKASPTDKECTDYASSIWTQVSGRSRPFHGDAKDWYAAAKNPSLKIQTIVPEKDRFPRVPEGSIVVWKDKPLKPGETTYGHVAIVTANDSNKKTMTISEMHWGDDKSRGTINTTTLSYDEIAKRVSKGSGREYVLEGFIPAQPTF